MRVNEKNWEKKVIRKVLLARLLQLQDRWKSNHDQAVHICDKKFRKIPLYMLGKLLICTSILQVAFVTHNTISTASN